MARASTILLAAAVIVLAACSGGDEVPAVLDTVSSTDSAAAGGAQDAAAPAPAPRPSPAPAPKPAPTHVVVKGTVLQVEMETALDSGTSQVGDRFTARVTKPVLVDGVQAIPAGARVLGDVSEVHKAKRGAGHGSLTLRFNGLKLADGFMTNMSASVSEETGGKKKRNAAIIGGSAAGGAILGRVLGDDSKDAAIGAIVGGAIGTGVVMAKEGEQVKMPAGTPLTLQLDAAIEVPARAENS